LVQLSGQQLRLLLMQRALHDVVRGSARRTASLLAHAALLLQVLLEVLDALIEVDLVVDAVRVLGPAANYTLPHLVRCVVYGLVSGRICDQGGSFFGVQAGLAARAVQDKVFLVQPVVFVRFVLRPVLRHFHQSVFKVQ